MRFEDVIMDYTPDNDGFQGIVEYGEYELSIIKNSASYGGNNGLYEIGLFKYGEMIELPGITAKGDTVKGFLTPEQVDGIMQKMEELSGVTGVTVW